MSYDTLQNIHLYDTLVIVLVRLIENGVLIEKNTLLF